MNKPLSLLCCVALMVLATPTPAHANVVVPMIAGAWFGMVILVLPIIAIESVMLFVALGVPFWKSLWVMALANVASTLVGIPIAAVFHGGLAGEARGATNTTREKVATALLRGPWVIGTEMDDPEKIEPWMELVAAMGILGIFLLASWLTEAWVVHLGLQSVEWHQVLGGALTANATTYGILAGVLLASNWLWNRSERAKERSSHSRNPQNSPTHHGHREEKFPDPVAVSAGDRSKEKSACNQAAGSDRQVRDRRNAA